MNRIPGTSMIAVLANQATETLSMMRRRLQATPGQYSIVQLFTLSELATASGGLTETFGLGFGMTADTSLSEPVFDNLYQGSFSCCKIANDRLYAGVGWTRNGNSDQQVFSWPATAFSLCRIDKCMDCSPDGRSCLRCLAGFRLIDAACKSPSDATPGYTWTD